MLNLNVSGLERLRVPEALGAALVVLTMVALVLGLMTGLPGMDFSIKCIFSGLLVVTMFAIDNSWFNHTNGYARVRVELDRVINDERALLLHLGELFNRPIVAAQVREIDFVRETMRLDVQTGPRK